MPAVTMIRHWRQTHQYSWLKWLTKLNDPDCYCCVTCFRSLTNADQLRSAFSLDGCLAPRSSKQISSTMMLSEEPDGYCFTALRFNIFMLHMVIALSASGRNDGPLLNYRNIYFESSKWSWLVWLTWKCQFRDGNRIRWHCDCGLRCPF